MKIPKSLGRYEVLDLISHGGMGTLFRARDPRIGRYVAIKVLKQDFDTPELRDRFSREARAAGCLSHPNIVTIYDVGEDDGLPFIAMEYVRGETFLEVVKLRPPLQVERKLQLIEEICAGLAHAHEAGIIHRDIKPANLILSSDGLVKILDFGIAKLASAGLTMPGTIMGTLNYMSPEQAKGNPVDARTDMFAVGVVMYELLSHQPAFPGTRPSEVLHKILSGAPTPITQYCPDLDPRVVQVMDRMLEKEPDRRFDTIAAVQKAIAAVRLDLQTGGAPWQRPTRQTRASHARPTADPAALRAERIQEYLDVAEHAFEGGDYDGAIEACKQVLMLDASNERALAELDRVHAATDERHAAVQSAVERGRAAFESGNLMSALREVKQALALDPYDADAQALSAQTEQAIKERQEESRIRAAVDSARRRFAAGDHRVALQALESLNAESNPLVQNALDELRRALDQIEEQQRVENEKLEQRRRIAALAADARTAIAAGRLEDATRIAAQIRQIDPSAPEIADVGQRVQQAQAIARTWEEVGGTLAEFDARLDNGDLPRADELLRAAAALSTGDPRVIAARQRLNDARAIAAAQAAAEARRREAEQALDAAAASLQDGDLAAAGDLLTRAAALAPGHPRSTALAAQLQLALDRKAAAEAAERQKREAEDLVRTASARLESAADSSTELAAALRDANRALELDAASADAARVKGAIEAAIAAKRQAALARTAIDNAGRRFANGKHQAAIKLLEEFDPPNHPDIVKALGELRAALQVIEEKRRADQEQAERQQRLLALVSEARTALGEQRFDDGLQILATAEGIDANAADIAPLKEQIVREQAAARLAAEIGGIVSEVDDRLGRGELDEARELLNKATALGATDQAVAAARQRLERATAERDAAVAREAAAVREREAAAAREAAARDAAAAREREAVAAREAAARDAAAAREREAAAARQAAAREALAAKDREASADAGAETLFAGDLQEAVRTAMDVVRRDQQRPPTVPPRAAVVEPVKDTATADAERARRTAADLLAAARAQLRAANPQVVDVTSALGKIEQALAAVPNDPVALALETTANEMLARLRDTATIDAAIRNARSRFAIGKHQAAIQLLESLDPASRPAVAEALKELRASLQAIEDRRRLVEAAARQPRPAADNDATRVILVSDVLAAQMQADTGGGTLVTTADAHGAPGAAKQPRDAAPSTAPPQSNAASQRLLYIGAGVLLLVLIVALLLLRFAR